MMAFRIFIAVIVAICAFLAYDTIRYKFMQHALLNTQAEYVLGNPDGDLTLVKFFEYSSADFRAMYPILAQTLNADGNVKFIARPIQTSSTNGIDPSLLPYAAAKQGAFAAMHDILIKNFRAINDQVLQDLSLEIGIDHEKLKTDLKDKAVLEAVQQNLKLFKDYKLSDTPAYTFDGAFFLIPQQGLKQDELTKLLKDVREFQSGQTTQ